MQNLLEYTAGLKNTESRIWVSHSGGFEEYCLQGYDIQSGERKPKFRSNKSPSSSGSKNKSSKEPEKQVAKHMRLPDVVTVSILVPYSGDSGFKSSSSADIPDWVSMWCSGLWHLVA
jgi:hypothetical protein